MSLALQLLAQQTNEQPKGSPFDPTFLLPMLAIGVLFYFLMLRPQRRQEKERQALLSALKKNDKVVTSGGIIGIVASVNEKQDEVTLKVDESSNVRLRVTKSSITRVLTPDTPVKDQKEAVKDQKGVGA